MAAPLGIHVLIDARECDSPLLADLDGLERLLIDAIDACNADVLGMVKNQSRPRRKKTGNGVELGVLLGAGESHATLHTYPELGKWLADIYIGGRSKPDKGVAVLRSGLGGLVNVTTIERGR